MTDHKTQYKDNLLREAIYRMDQNPTNSTFKQMILARKLSKELRIDNENDQFSYFCVDYLAIRKSMNEKIDLINRQFSDKKIDLIRTFQNGALSASLGLFEYSHLTSTPLSILSDFSADPEGLQRTVAAAGAGMAITSYDELVNKRTMNLRPVWLSAVIGGIFGHFLTDGEEGKYLLAGISAAMTTIGQVIKGSQLRSELEKSFHKNSKENIMDIFDDHKKETIDSLVNKYSQII